MSTPLIISYFGTMSCMFGRGSGRWSGGCDQCWYTCTAQVCKTVGSTEQNFWQLVSLKMNEQNGGGVGYSRALKLKVAQSPEFPKFSWFNKKWKIISFITPNLSWVRKCIFPMWFKCKMDKVYNLHCKKMWWCRPG